MLTGKVAALPRIEAVAKVALPPLVGLVEMPDFYFVGFQVSRKPVAKCEVSIQTHEFAKIYGTRKSFPVYGSFTAEPGAKALTSM